MLSFKSTFSSHWGKIPCVQKFVFPSKRVCSCCSNAVRIIPGLIGWACVLLTKPSAPLPYAWEADHSHCVRDSCKELLQSVKQCLCPPATIKAKSSLYNKQGEFSFFLCDAEERIQRSPPFFYWDILVLQFVLVSANKEVNQLYVYIYPHLLRSPSHPPNSFHPSRLPQRAKLSSLGYRVGPR